MQIAIASGKGGTGKTTVAVNLASVHRGYVTLLDCDVEEPNVHLFIKPDIIEDRAIDVLYPELDMGLCTGCGDCRRACRFNAIVIIKDTPLLIGELCHSCGACMTACPVNAITEVGHKIGSIDIGKWKHGNFAHGTLDIGQARSEPLIGAVRDIGRNRPDDELVLIDAPPGTSCPAIASVDGADYVVLVTEPTPFGLHDLKLAIGMCHALGLPVGVVINRSDIGDSGVLDHCLGNNIPVLATFPFDRKIAETYSRGEILVEHISQLRMEYENLLGRIFSEAGR